MKKIIEFINNSAYENLIKPVPANTIIPEWYKKLNPYFHNSNKEMIDAGDNTRSTMKKCIPVFDMITSGYLYLLPFDLEVTQINNQPFFTWNLDKPVSFHSYKQTEGYPNITPLQSPAKLEGYWGYKTPKGYSCLFMPPSHRENIIEILPAIVDTDTYNYTVNFPFILKDNNFTGIIPKGTPMVQIIPIKRDVWSHKISLEDKQKSNKDWYTLKSTFVNAYKNNYWNRKEYK
jgi:hypothetical protein